MGGFHFVQIVPDDFPPNSCDGFVVAEEHIIGVKFNHFLKANNDNINILGVKIEQSIKILWFQRFGIDHVAVPSQHKRAKLLIAAIVCFLNDFVRDVVLEVIGC